MKFFNKFFSQTGSAIILSLVAVGIISTLIFYLMNFSVSTNKKIAADASVISYKNLVDVVRSRIYSGKTCTDLLGGINLPNEAFRLNGSNSEYGIPIALDLKLEMNKKILQAPPNSNPSSIWRLKGGTSIKDVRLVINERLRARVMFTSIPDKFIAAKGFILIIPDHTGVGVKLNQNRHYRIPILLYYKGVGSNRTLFSCFDPVGEAFVCTMTAFGAYDVTENNPLLRCHPQRYCKSDGGGIRSTGNCNSPFSKKFIGYENQTTPNFICEWCPPLVNQGQIACYENFHHRYYEEPPTAGFNSITTPFKAFNDLTEAQPDIWTSDPCNIDPAGGGTAGGGTFGGGTAGGGTAGGGTAGGGAAGGGTAGGGGAGGTTGSCFVAGTEITLFDGSKKNIEDIRLGESLVDLKGTKVKVQKLISYDYEGPIYSINGGPYFFTPNHPFLTTSGWKSLDPKKSMEETPGLKVSHLMLGDILLKRDGVEVVLSLDSINIKDKVYNFSLDGTHEYIANEFAVHNKMPQMPVLL